MISGFELGYQPSHLFEIVPDPIDPFDLLVMNRFIRTFKLLYAILQGKPVVKSSWIYDSEHQKRLKNHEEYLLEGPKKVITKSTKKVLEGYKVFEGLNIILASNLDKYHMKVEQIELLIFAGGGESMSLSQSRKSKKNLKDILIIPSNFTDEDLEIARHTKKDHIYSLEFILSSCLHQEINWEAHRY